MRTLRQIQEEALTKAEKAYLQELLQMTKGNVSWSARLAGADRTTIYRLAHRHGLMSKCENKEEAHREGGRVGAAAAAAKKLREAAAV